MTRPDLVRALRWSVAAGLVITVLVAAVVTWTYDPGPPPARIGDPVSPSRLPVVGKPDQHVSLADFRGKGLLVNVWATWCDPCVREMPLLVRLAERYAGAHFAVIGVSDDEQDKLLAFLAKTPLPFPVLHDADGALRAQLGADVLPYTLFIGPDGTTVAKKVGQLRETQAAETIERLIVAARKAEKGT